MKKSLLLLLFASLVCAATAQISFTAANAPKAGTSVKTQSSENDSLLRFNTGLAGANRIWNFASFRFDPTLGIAQTNFISPARTIYANDRRVNGATYGAFDIDTPTDITFDSISAGTWWTIAAADTGGVRRQNPITRQLTFPWTYNSAFRDSVVERVYDPSAGDTLSVITVTNVKCDAYGSITTPIGTFNALRTTRAIKAQVEFIPGLGIYLSINTTEWWTTQHPQPVFSHSRINFDAFGTVDSFAAVYSIVQTRVANEEVAQTDLKTYPNPVQNTVNIDFEISEAQNVALTVFSLSGQIMHLDRFNVPQGKQQRTIDVSNMPNGVYMLYLGGEKDKRLGMRKIVVQH